jgi:sensor histidine kinase YesM
MITGLQVCVQAQRINANKRVLKVGDNMDWAQPEYDDSSWGYQPVDDYNIFWVRFEIDFDKRIDEIKYKGVEMISLGSYEAYWDGQLIYQNGKVGINIDEEVPGTFLSHFILPDSLCGQGKHFLAMRVSNFHSKINLWSWNNFHVEEYLSTSRKNLKLTALMFILGGAFLIAAIYYLFLFFIERRKFTTLIFSLLCFCFFGLIIMEFLKFFYEYPYYFHNYRLCAIGLLTLSIAIMLPNFVYLEFKIPHWKYFALIYCLGLCGFVLHYGILSDYPVQLLSIVMLMVSIGITGFAIYIKSKGAWIILITLIIIGFINSFKTYDIKYLLFSYDINLFVSFIILILSFLYLMAQQRKEEQLAYESSLLLSSRLKVELLKKNIQPHFIMNTLTSIMEWVETSPKKSIEFIEALANEFEILNEIAEEQLIPIQQEINLCKQHLAIMTFRKEIHYELNEIGIDPTEKIPPAILHTIIENGITHSKPINGKIKFELKFERLNNLRLYEIKTIAENRSMNKKSGGTGFKYIKSRLTESYGNNWELKSAATENGWLTSIIILEK